MADRPKPPLPPEVGTAQGAPPTKEQLTESVCFMLAASGVTLEVAIDSITEVLDWLAPVEP